MSAKSEKDGDTPRQASDWLIRLQEEPDNPELRARFRAWRDASDANEAAWAETAQAYDLIGPASLAPSLATARPSPLPATWRARVTTAGFAAALACLAIVFLPGTMIRWQADYRTGAGETRALHLDDGSVVDLAPGSAIAVAFSEGKREIRLLSGRAFFEVMPDAARPFEVDAEGLRTTVLGTAFEIWRGDDPGTVSVSHGLVRVDRKDASTPLAQQLRPGEWLRIDRQGHAETGRTPPEQIAAWREGRLIARDRPFAEILDELRPYYAGMILLLDAPLGERRVTGVYNLREPEDALRALARAHEGVEIRRLLPWLLVISGG